MKYIDQRQPAYCNSNSGRVRTASCGIVPRQPASHGLDGDQPRESIKFFPVKYEYVCATKRCYTGLGAWYSHAKYMHRISLPALPEMRIVLIGGYSRTRVKGFNDE